MYLRIERETAIQLKPVQTNEEKEQTKELVYKMYLPFSQ